MAERAGGGGKDEEDARAEAERCLCWPAKWGVRDVCSPIAICWTVGGAVDLLLRGKSTLLSSRVEYIPVDFWRMQRAQ